MTGKPAARKTDAVKCPRCGMTAISTGSPDVLINGLPAARLGDCTHCGSELNSGASSTVFFNGQAALVTGSEGTHGSVIIGGSGNVIIGNTHTPAPFIPTVRETTNKPDGTGRPDPRASLTDFPPTHLDNRDTSLEEEEEEEEIQDSAAVGVTLRIGVFFDGTLNNGDNGALGLLCNAPNAIGPEDLQLRCKDYMRSPDSSYANDESNISKLRQLYLESSNLEGIGNNRQFSKAIYVAGIGTSSGQADSLMGAAFGRGNTGVSAKVEQAFVDVKKEVFDFAYTCPGVKITQLVFDVFGFSRGAAAARHFSNEVALGLSGPLVDTFRLLRGIFHPAFNWNYQKSIHVGFIGLFDTVASIGGLSNLGNVRSDKAPGLNLHLPRALFPNVVQLAARDEYRANFPLSRVKPDHLELTLPGAHSDIGGGYALEAEEHLYVSPMMALDVSLKTDVRSTSIYHDAQRVRDEWLAKGWPAEMLEIVMPRSLELPPIEHGRPNPDKRVYAALRLKRTVRGELSRVYLRVMYALGQEKGVPFAPLDPSDKSLYVPNELEALSERFIAGDYGVSPDEERLLKLHFIHISANWDAPRLLRGSTPRISAELLYFNAPTLDGVRVQHPHVPG